MCHISRTPGKDDGAQLDFESELENTIKKQVSVIASYWSHICLTFGNNEQQVSEFATSSRLTRSQIATKHDDWFPQISQDN